MIPAAIAGRTVRTVTRPPRWYASTTRSTGGPTNTSFAMRAQVVVHEDDHGVRVLIVVIVEHDAQSVAGDVLRHDRAGQPEAGDPRHPVGHVGLRPAAGQMRPLQRQAPGRTDRAGQTRQQDKGIRVAALAQHPGRVGPEEPLDLADLVGLPGRPELVREQGGRAARPRPRRSPGAAPAGRAARSSSSVSCRVSSTATLGVVSRSCPGHPPAAALGSGRTRADQPQVAAASVPAS